MTTALTVVDPQAESIQTVPDYIPRGSRGSEHMTRTDMKLPQLALAQKGSPQIEEDNPAWIEGVKFLDLFNSVTEQNYGRGPLPFAIIQANPPRYVQFRPKSEGGGVLDPRVPADDARTRFGPNGEKPAATMFYDFVIVLLPSYEIVVLSLKSTQLKTARFLNTLIKLRGTDIYTGVYTVEAFKDPNESKGVFGGFKIRNAGWVAQADLDNLKHMFEQFETVTVEVQAVQQDDVAPVTDAEIPF